jgi:hypothetical protein
VTLRTLAAGLLFATTVTFCIAGCAPEPPATEAEKISCTPWYHQTLPGGDAVFINNTWNEQWARGQPYSQCLLRRTHGGIVQYGWQWSWPPFRPYSSYAAPEVMSGWSPWHGIRSTTPLLPERIDALQSVRVDFAVNLSAQGGYDLNTTMWILDRMPASSRSDPSLVRGELMVWFAHEPRGFGGLDSDGEVTLDGVTFDVWHQRNHGDDSGGSARSWTMIVYVSREDSLRRSFDLKLILDDAARKRLVDPGHVVGGVELISEIFGGSGELWLERFRVTTVKKAVGETR